MVSADPLLQPFVLKHLTLRNRIMTTAHEPAYTDAGMPKGRYRAYHAARAKGGIALAMTAGSASVGRDSPPAFGTSWPTRTKWCPGCATSPMPATSTAPP